MTRRTRLNPSATTSDVASPFAHLLTMPAGLGWDTTHFPLTAWISDVPGLGRSFGKVSVTPESLFDAVSTARSSPGATFYCNWTSGSDANNGTAVGTPFKSIWKAIAAANTAAVPSTIFVAANPASGLAGASYFRTNNPWYNGGAGVYPSVDIALIATGGRVNTGTFDTVGTPSRDGTQTNCYAITVSSVNRVVDITRPNAFGNYTEFPQVSTAALCNAMPDTWALVSGTLYVNRRDQQAVTNSNTRMFRPATSNIGMRTPVNYYIGGQTGNDGFDFEGGSNIGTLDVTTTTPGTTNHVFVAKNCTFKYGGGYTDTASKSVAVDSFQGLAAFFNCRADAGWSDGFNHHNNNSATNPLLLTVNCSGYDNGRGSSTSNNGWTSHETCIGIDVAGHYAGNRGGSVRSINSAKGWLGGTFVENDLGDLGMGGVQPPTAFQVDNTATYWCDRTRLNMPAGAFGYVALNTATLHKRNVWPTAHADQPTGTIDTY